ncbi:MAG TPA: DUF1508 domain-containing protein, partial [Dokdonella sp.]|nr:DUF1508 domain-containing protein [Dokdonella sp.]
LHVLGVLSLMVSARSNTMNYEKYRDTSTQWRWRLLASNGKIIANSGEGYHNEADCDHAITLVKGSGNAPVRKK